MIIVCWNCCGAVSKKFFRHILDIISTCRLDILFLLETKVQSDRAQRILRMRGFDGFVVAEAKGFAGDIWCYWKSIIELQMLSKNDQCISLGVMRETKVAWLLTIIYASHCQIP